MDLRKTLEEIDTALNNAKSQKEARNMVSAVRSVILSLEKCNSVLQIENLCAEDKSEVTRRINLITVELAGFLEVKSIVKQPRENSSAQNVMQIDNIIVTPTHDIHLSDLIGLKKPKLALMESILLPIILQSSYEMSMKYNGVLLFGPTGVGKSSIVRAVVNECSMHLQKMSLSPVTFFNFSMNHILGAYHGHTEKNLSYLFDKANEKQPSVILIDEIDSLTMKRTENERESTRKIKNHLLSLMDGLAGHARITVVGTTNKAEDMDVGFLRRFDRRCYIGLPNAKEREFVLRKCIGELQVDDETINFAEFADNTYNFSPSDIKSFVKLAYHNAHWRDMACAMLEQLETRGVIIPDNLQTTASFKRITNEALADARRCITATNNTKDVMDLESFAKLYATDYDDPTVFINDPCNFPHCPTNWLTAIQCCICSIAEILD